MRHFLRDREQLLLINNFEQVAEAGPLLVELLVACPGLTMLVTSRAALRLSGKRVYAVLPLALPERAPAGQGQQSLPTLAELASVEAVRLFVDRAEIAAGAFALTPDNAVAVVAICERTDGLPLATELAAARAALLSPEALQERLDPRLPLLADGPRDQPARLRTMRDAIAWGHDLLSAEAVAEGMSLDLMQRLVDQAVLQRQIGGADEPRLTMLETIREYGLERLVESGEEAAVRDAHAAWCVAFAEQAGPELAGPDQANWVRRLEAEGLADKEIVAALFVARATASKHVAAILEKLGVESRTAAVAVALRHNLV